MRTILSGTPQPVPNDVLPVVLGSFGESVIVHGNVKPRLTRAQQDVVEVLLEAGNDGLTKDKLDQKSGHVEARKILKRLANSDPDWQAVIKMPGRSGCRYRSSEVHSTRFARQLRPNYDLPLPVPHFVWAGA